MGAKARPALAALAIVVAACAARDRDALTQVSTLRALATGAYGGVMACSALKAYGDFGLGTFDALDGEMQLLDGRVYQVRADGMARPAPDGLTTPFAAVTFFAADRRATLGAGLSLQGLRAAIDSLLPDTTAFYAVRVEGAFRSIRTRSVPRQRPPYRPLASVVPTQRTFDFAEVRGTLIGVRTPAAAGDLNQPGYHFHFLTADHSAGGHVLSLVTRRVAVLVDRTPRWQIVLP